MEFVKQVGKKKGLSQSMLNEAGGKIATYGSFRLGVFGPGMTWTAVYEQPSGQVSLFNSANLFTSTGSDIDTLVVAPKHVSRDDFFDQFPAILESMSQAGAVEDMKPVRDAHVPIIKLEYSGISMDLIFARLLVSSVPFNLDLKNDDLLRGLDEVDQRCLNGTRVSDLIISLVPQDQTFRHTLRTIKLWAQREYSIAPRGVARC